MEDAVVTLTAVGVPNQVITVPVHLSVGNTFVAGNTTATGHAPSRRDDCPDRRRRRDRQWFCGTGVIPERADRPSMPSIPRQPGCPRK